MRIVYSSIQVFKKIRYHKLRAYKTRSRNKQYLSVQRYIERRRLVIAGMNSGIHEKNCHINHRTRVEKEPAGAENDFANKTIKAMKKETATQWRERVGIGL